MPTTTSAEHLYVYAAVEGAVSTLPSVGMPEGSAPRALPLDSQVSLIVSSVPSATYSAAALEPKLSDLDWVGTAGAAHHVVVDALLDSGLVVVPFRLFTIFSSEATALDTLRSARDALAGVFDRVRGRQEWVLKIGRPDPARIKSSSAPEPAETSGRSFLQAKSAARREAAARAERVNSESQTAFDALMPYADAAASRPVDPNGTLIIDAAFLVPASRVDAMKDALTRAAAQLLKDGCPVSLTGPWPPYSFAAMDANTDA